MYLMSFIAPVIIPDTGMPNKYMLNYIYSKLNSNITIHSRKDTKMLNNVGLFSFRASCRLEWGD